MADPKVLPLYDEQHRQIGTATVDSKGRITATLTDPPAALTADLLRHVSPEPEDG